MNLKSLFQYWEEREPRERALLACGISLAGAALMYLTLIQPAFSAIGHLQRALPDARARSAHLEALLSEVRALKSRRAIGVGADQRAALEQSLAAAGLKPARVVQQADGALQLTFADVPYAAWSVWLAAAERALGMHAISVEAKATSTAGNVDVGLAIRSGHE